MICPMCGLPDPYRGQGDGIGSCECHRCDCCGAGPDDCECSNDWDDQFAFDDSDEELNDAFDPLCNDPGCSTHLARMAAKK